MLDLLSCHKDSVNPEAADQLNCGEVEQNRLFALKNPGRAFPSQLTNRDLIDLTSESKDYRVFVFRNFDRQGHLIASSKFRICTFALSSSRVAVQEGRIVTVQREECLWEEG
ncbi:MAG TPA: hypothetical protein VKU19_24355 [Bryobacteraceae bacterium]|nr:hypothetical protein [Bryobacteraceae bacterium]